MLQIGDSHTANDAFSSRLRALMQARFGAAGRGMLPPGVPYRYYKPAQVQASMQGWRTLRSGLDDSVSSNDGGRFGFAGLRQESADGSMTLTADPPGLAHASVELLAQPGGGGVDVAGKPVSTAGHGILHVPVPTQPGTSAITLRAMGDGPVDVLSWSAGTGQRGVTWSNLGTVGAQVSLLRRWDPAVLASEAAALQPALIVLAFGTNEGFKDSLDLGAYPGDVRAAIALLRRAAPGASILVAGPPGGVRAGPGLPCPGDGPGAGWSVPPNLPAVRRIQARIAAEEGLAFWDWAGAMGGDCAMAAWAQTDPPLAARDHVHLLEPGYQRTADALYAALLQGYAPP